MHSEVTPSVTERSNLIVVQVPPAGHAGLTLTTFPAGGRALSTSSPQNAAQSDFLFEITGSILWFW